MPAPTTTAELPLKVRKIIWACTNDPIALLPRLARFKEDLGLSTLQTLDIILAIEDEFGLDISPEAAEPLKTIQDLIEYVQQHSKAS